MSAWMRTRRFFAGLIGGATGELPMLVRQLEAERASLIDAQAVAAVGSWETDLRTLELIWSAETHRIFETGDAFQPTHRHFLELVHPDDRSAVDAAFKRSIGDTGACAMEHRILLPDGRVKYVQERWRTFSDAAGQPLRAVGTSQDITERKASEAALRDSDERFRLLAEAVPQMVWITRADGWNEYFNQQWVDYTGMSLAESAGHGWSKPFHPDHRQRAEEAWRHATATLGIYSLECLLRRADGVYRWWLIRGAPLKESDGTVRKWFGTCTDIHDLKLAELEVSRTNRALTMLSSAAGPSARTGSKFFEQLAGNVAEAFGAHGGFVSVLLPGEPLMARTIGAVVGGEAVENFSYVVSGTPCEQMLTSDTSVISDRVAVQFPGSPGLAALGAEGYVGRRLSDSSGQIQGFLFVLFREPLTHVEFITSTLQIFAARAASELERQEVDARVREQDVLLLRAQRMESIGTLAGGIAHDLNNMLTPILMAIAVLDEIVTDETGRGVLATMHSSAQRGADLVKQVLSFARGVEGQRIPVNALYLMRELLRVIRGTLPKPITIDFVPGDDLWAVTGDPTQIHQVFMNLFINARDAMAGRGHLVVSIDNVVIDDAITRLNADARPGAYVRVRVADDGAGIPAEQRDRIFEPFFTTKAIGEGTGLGLSTSLAIVKSHGGFIQLESVVGRGTTFDVYLPANTAEAATERPDVARQRLERGNGELVLVVDDEDGILKMAQRLLERQGYRTLLACNGKVAVDLYARHQHEIAVVLTDMAMPIMDGPALILALKAINPGVRIVASSGFTSIAGMARALRDGAEQFVPKPYTGDALLTVLQAVINAPAPAWEGPPDGSTVDRG